VTSLQLIFVFLFASRLDLRLIRPRKFLYAKISLNAHVLTQGFA